jgi:hypothetical protein
MSAAIDWPRHERAKDALWTPQSKYTPLPVFGCQPGAGRRDARRPPAAASIASVPRSLTSAVSPLFSGYPLSVSAFGWPFLIASAVKIVYDVLLLAMFRKVGPP